MPACPNKNALFVCQHTDATDFVLTEVIHGTLIIIVTNNYQQSNKIENNLSVSVPIRRAVCGSKVS